MKRILVLIFYLFINACTRSGNSPNTPIQPTDSIPTLTTITANSIAQASALSGGVIYSDGGASVLAHGICWSTSTNPNLSNSFTNDGSGKGTFISSLTGLIANTTYYIRAYATNKIGTAYGNQVSFTTLIKTGITVAGNSNGTAGSGPGELAYPAGVFVDSLGNIYVADQNNNRVQKYAPGATSGITVAGGNGSGPFSNQITAPTGIFVDKANNIYITDGADNRVQKWIPGATTGITVAGTDGYLLNKGSASNQLNGPWGIFVDPNGNIYIADAGNNRVQKWAPNAIRGVTVAGDSTGIAGYAANQLNFPQGVYVDGNGYLYIADAKNNRIQKWAPGASSGITVAGGSWGQTDTQLGSPSNVFLDITGNIYIADWDFGRIQKWASGATSGTTVAGGNGLGVSPNQLYSPACVFVDKGLNIFIADFKNNRIQKW